MTALGRMYVVIGSAAVTTAVDVFEIVAPADSSVVIHSAFVGQYSDFGDAEAEMLRVSMFRGHTTSGSGGSAATPNPLELGGSAFGGTAEAYNTTLATAGASQGMYADSFNIASGLHYRPTPEERIVLSPSQRFVVRLIDAPADSLSFWSCIYFEELGG